MTATAEAPPLDGHDFLHAPGDRVTTSNGLEWDVVECITRVGADYLSRPSYLLSRRPAYEPTHEVRREVNPDEITGPADPA